MGSGIARPPASPPSRSSFEDTSSSGRSEAVSLLSGRSVPGLIMFRLSDRARNLRYPSNVCRGYDAVRWGSSRMRSPELAGAPAGLHPGETRSRTAGGR